MYKKIEILTNSAVLIVALLLGVVLVQRLFFSPTASAKPAAIKPIPVGTSVAIPGLDWSASERTLLIAVRPGCRFCTASAPFYRKLLQEASNRSGARARIVVVSGAAADDTRAYLREIDVPADRVERTPLESLGVQGTPTLILVDRSGSVVDSWIGRLNTQQEARVVLALAR